jgi:hypothetical protein
VGGSATEHSHEGEPTELALRLAAALRQDRTQEKKDGTQDRARDSQDQVLKLCDDCGNRLAQAVVGWSDWVVRRVEKVRFRDDRTVNRQISVDFVVRNDAPVFDAGSGRKFWLVPVSIMRRKTLVNFDLRDEKGSSLPLPGLRLTQRLDESILRAVALSELRSLWVKERSLWAEKHGQEPPPEPAPTLDEDTAAFIHDAIAGDLRTVQTRVRTYSSGGDSEQIRKLRGKPGLFDALFHRLSYHFVLYSFVEIGEGRRHRIIHMSIDEPLALYYRRPGLMPPKKPTTPPTAGPVAVTPYELGKPVRWFNHHRLGAALGFKPTRIRFPVPAAENAASFHFEVAAPPGVDIVEASMLAGQPEPAKGATEAERRVSFDRIKLRLPTVGLHVAGVPNGSSSRAQVHLQVAVRGWYATMVVSCWVTFGLLLAILLNLGTSRVNTSDLVALLASLVAAIATLITQREFEGIAGRLLGLSRILASTEALLLLGATALFLFLAPGKGQSWPGWVPPIIESACIAAGIISLVISGSWVAAFLRQRREDATSPWEMGPEVVKPAEPPAEFWEGARTYKYTRPAIRVDSAEAWHHQFRWTEAISQGVQRLGQRDSSPSAPAEEEHLRFPWASRLRGQWPGVHNGGHGRGRSAVRGSDRG